MCSVLSGLCLQIANRRRNNYVLYLYIFCSTTFVMSGNCFAEQPNPNSNASADNTDLLANFTNIAFNKYLDVENLDVKSKNISKDILKEVFSKILYSLQHLKKRNTQPENGKFCEVFPKVSTGVPLQKLCQEAFSSQCLSTEDLVNVLPPSVETFPEALKYVCPFLLLQSHDPVCQKQIRDQPTKKQSSRPSASAVWGFGFLFVTIVSCCSLVGVGLLPLLSKSFYHMVLVLFEGLAVGSLASSALFHLIPQAFNLLGQDAQHNYLWKALIIFGGIYLFFLSERTMKIFIQRKEKKRRKRDQLSPNFNHLSVNISPSASAISSTTLENGVLHEACIKEGDGDGNIRLPPDTVDFHSHNHHQHLQPNDLKQGKNVIATVAWMIIFGDGLHNFIDGLSMGAAFSESILSGISISVAVICEEFPHELGDFAVLLSAGMTMKQALMYNFMSACTCYLGLVFGVFLGDLAEGGPYIFALAGGMFLYISLVDMMGELSEALETASKVSTKEMLKVFALQNIGILIGVAALFLMARYSEKINFDALSTNSTNSSGLMTEFSDLFHTNENYRAFEDAMKGV